MAWIIFGVIVGLALFQFNESRRFRRDDRFCDCVWSFIAGVIYSAIAAIFGLGALLG